ncbi:hypothetical protein CC80DRAFT_256910 [Byssothecium circinans]|uniref:Rhodopsin domain-containing protein n=1 Tax=Byssothecium circinans TaxID=147558 RepID=A0A6A5T9G4_9PLEO|nr:hypothetical protein CC80DRAFT_256910 [Byssothecium circinans]
MDQEIVSDVNRTPVVQIVTWLCLAVSILAFFTHAGIKFHATRAMGAETILVFLSLVFGTAQSISVLLQTSNGFGKPSSTLGDGEVDAILKSEYAATMLFFCSIAFSKFTLIAFIHGLTPRQSYRCINYGLGGFSLAWLLVAIFVSAFQCPLPRPWEKARPGCIDYLNWWNAATSMNIISEIAIVGLEVSIILALQIRWPRKASIVSLFACRLLVVVAIALQLHLSHKENSSSRKDDVALGYWQSTVGNQVVQCLGIVTTTLPYANMFMESFESGLIGAERVGGRSGKSGDGSGRTYELLDFSRGSSQPVSAPRHGISTTKTYTVESALKSPT